MRGYWRAVALLLVAGPLQPGGAAAQTGFNGVVTFQMDRSGGKRDTLVQTTKGHKLRIDGFGSSHGWMIMDNDSKSMMMVEPDKQQYMLMTEEDSKQMQAMMGPMMERMKQQQAHRTDPGKVNFAKTGRTEIVAGVPCEVWHGEYTDESGEKDEGEACVATGVGFALSELTYNNPIMQSGGAAHEQFEQYRQLVGGNKGILKATSIKKGKTSTELEAIKIERKVVGDEVFAPPAGYKEIRMGDLMMQAHPMRNRHGQGDPQLGEPEKKQGQGEPKGGQGQGQTPQ